MAKTSYYDSSYNPQRIRRTFKMASDTKNRVDRVFKKKAPVFWPGLVWLSTIDS